MILIFLGEPDFSEAYGAKRKKKMKFDEQDRVRDHASWFLSGLFFGNTTHSDFSSKIDANRTRARQKWCIPRKKSVYICPDEKTLEQKLRRDKYKLSFLMREMLFFFLLLETIPSSTYPTTRRRRPTYFFHCTTNYSFP